MFTWLPSTATRKCNRTRPAVTLEQLEAREVPAVNILLDYSLDARANGGSGFFESNPQAVAVLNVVAAEHGARLTASLGAISPGGGNDWSATFFDPRTGSQISISNLSVAADTLRVYVGARNLGVSAGVGGYGGFSASGTQGWLNYLGNRGNSGFGPWGGSISFGTTTNWSFAGKTETVGAGQVDFYSVAVHEMGHLLGIGTSPQWNSFVSGGTFNGPNARAVYGGAVPLEGTAHWADNVTVNGQSVALDPRLLTGTRVNWSSLDAAALTDIGWQSSTATPVSPPTTPISPPPAATPIAPVAVGNPVLNVTANGAQLVVLTGPTDGTAQVFSQDANGTLTAAGPRFNPFPGYTGVLRSVVSDFNGDGQADFAFGTGAGTSGTVRIISGATGTDLVGPTSVLNGFRGGVFLAAGDVDRDGAAELAVSADAGGGTRVSLFKMVGGSLSATADFLAYGDAHFRGGSRVALGDVNRDGVADLIVGAGIGGAPRVAVYDGGSLLSGFARTVVPDFFALDSNLRSGVFVSAADLDGDGYSEVIYSTGNTGGPRVRIVSGQTLTSNPGRDVYFLPAMADFFAFDQNDRSGLRIATRDLNADGKAELVVATGAKTGGVVRVLTLADIQNPGSMTAKYQSPFNDPTTIDGIYVG